MFLYKLLFLMPSLTVSLDSRQFLMYGELAKFSVGFYEYHVLQG